MSHTRDVLVNDRPFVEFARGVMRGSSDQLHPTRMRLMIWPPSRKCRQERVMDVDDGSFEDLQEIAGQSNVVRIRRRDAEGDTSVGGHLWRTNSRTATLRENGRRHNHREHYRQTYRTHRRPPSALACATEG